LLICLPNGRGGDEINFYDLAKDLKKMDNADKKLGRGIASVCYYLWA
jgi:hypothetical protein